MGRQRERRRGWIPFRVLRGTHWRVPSTLSSSLAFQRAHLRPHGRFSHSPWPLTSLFLHLYPHPTLVPGVPASMSLASSLSLEKFPFPVFCVLCRPPVLLLRAESSIPAVCLTILGFGATRAPELLSSRHHPPHPRPDWAGSSGSSVGHIKPRSEDSSSSCFIM